MSKNKFESKSQLRLSLGHTRKRGFNMSKNKFESKSQLGWVNIAVVKRGFNMSKNKFESKSPVFVNTSPNRQQSNYKFKAV
ncbi:MAG: hypothetical protein A2V66_01280 [Ignavibacteria bacterium RBG_13_36_8]|nr:MAG: hypothetical protein A2V66_01280 [Ignavibacteria bacterium RBG_13_36_8]